MVITPEEYKPGTIATIPTQKRGRGNPKTKTRTAYKDVICTFDIETSRLQPEEQSIMYVWMLHIHPDTTIVGRTWEQLATLFQRFNEELEDNTLCIFVHNLSYEFQFLQAIHQFTNEEVFAVDRRKVLKCTMDSNKFEFRCSYLHCNMSLAE